MSDSDNNIGVIEFVRRNDRYFLSLLAAFVLSLLLLFFKELTPWMQRYLIPSYVVYLLGTALIAQIQQMVGMREQLRCAAANRSFLGTHRYFFAGIIAAHVLWFAAWIAFLLAHAPLT